MASPRFSGYVDVGALELYCERHGDGHPLVLLHGAFGTIESSFAGLLPALARTFEVIAVELQGHGRTRDVGRPLAYQDMAADLAALLEALRIPRAHFAGYSLGGAVALADTPLTATEPKSMLQLNSLRQAGLSLICTACVAPRSATSRSPTNEGEPRS